MRDERTSLLVPVRCGRFDSGFRHGTDGMGLPVEINNRVKTERENGGEAIETAKPIE